VRKRKTPKRWTEEEHAAFMEGVAQEGKGSWKEISEKFVHSKTATQVQSHAKTFFSKQAAKMETKGKATAGRQRWDEAEHSMFLTGLEREGKGNWTAIANNYVKTKTPGQVQNHAQTYFDRLQRVEKGQSVGVHKLWTNAEHEQFLHGLKTHGKGRWKEISENFVPTKTPGQVRTHAKAYFTKIERAESGTTMETPGPWTDAEHAAFLKGLKKCGKGNWKGIAEKYVFTRTAEQIQGHAKTHFDRMQRAANGESLRRPQRWTDEEHNKFLEGLGELGVGNWTAISEKFVLTKTPIQVKGHAWDYFDKLKKEASGKLSINRDWTEQEHALFLQGVSSVGIGDWEQISQKFVKTKTPAQIQSYSQKHFGKIQKKSEEAVKLIQNILSYWSNGMLMNTSGTGTQ